MLGVASVALWAAGCARLKPSADPISRWELDETSSAAGVFEDRGPAHVLMVHAGLWADLTTGPLVAGDDGTSAYTDGSAYATIPADVAAHDLAALTISFYYQRDSASDKHILLAAGNGSQIGDFSIEVLANGQLRGWHTGQDGVLRFFESTNGVAGTNLQVGTAHRIDLSLGPQGARIYLDGAELAAAAIPQNVNGWNNGRVKYLGRWTDGVLAPAVGVFDRLRIWNRQLTGAEIAALEAAQSIELPGEPGPGLMLSAPLTAFGHTRVRVTSLAGWPAGRVPREIASQGSLAHAYVRRAWKQTDNDGSWIDFQAGWRNGVGDSVTVRLDDGGLLDISFDVTNAVPSPGPGGVVRTLDKLGGGNFTTWSAAIAALNTNDVLVVRARAGGEVYPMDQNVGGPVSTANGVKVVAHPDDLSAGRRPRIHVQGTKFARYADDLNNGHWEVHQDLGSPHGKVWRTTAAVGAVVNVGCSYRSKGGGLRRCYTYTNTSGTPGALARLTDTTYPRIQADPNDSLSDWDLYMGPGIYLHSDGRLYIRLSPLRDGVGAIQVDATAGMGPNPPWDWSDDDPESEDPNQCQLYISSSDDNISESGPPSTGINYVIRINNTSNWTFENLDWVSGGNGIEVNDSSNLTLRGCRALGWAPPNMQDDPDQSTIKRTHAFLEMISTTGVVCEFSEFWGGAAPWVSWDENKVRHGAYSCPQKSNLYWVFNTSNDPSFNLRFVNCLLDGFMVASRPTGKPDFIDFHQCSLRYWGSDGALVHKTPSQRLSYIRCQIFAGTLAGWANQSGGNDGDQYVGYCLINNFRPYMHENGWWDIDPDVTQGNQFVCGGLLVGHETYKDCLRHFYYNNTSIGAHHHRNSTVVKPSGAGFGSIFRDGSGAGIFPYNRNADISEWWSRNNICAVRPNGSFGRSDGGTGGPSGDSHVGLVMHQDMVGFRVGSEAYSSDYNIYHRASGMPTISGQHNGVVTTVDENGTERERDLIADVRSDTGQEQNGRIVDPQFVGAWDAEKLDRELHTNAQWCIPPTSAAASGGDTTNRSWPDLDFGTEITYGGNTWLGCMDPEASAIEQQVGPLGPLPSAL